MITSSRQPPPLNRLLRYSRPFSREIWLASICSVLNKVFDLAPPALIGMAVDVVVQKDQSAIARWGIPDVGGQLALICGLSIIIWGLESLFE
jgi:ATP-binding cassette, subfamily B, bacterial